MALSLRKCEVLSITQNGADHTMVKGEWEEVPFAKLKKGQIYRLFDSDYKFENGTDVCVALTDAAPTEPDGNFFVESISLAGW